MSDEPTFEPDFLRQLDVFSPEKYKSTRIDVIGVGATGSYIVWLLAKIGLANIHIWDDDVIESHNLPNQMVVSLKDCKRKKVEALRDRVKEATGIELTIHDERVDGTQKLGKIVYLAVDSMKDRKTIYEKALKLKITTSCVIETRMSVDMGRIYFVNPLSPTQTRTWESTLCSDNDAEVSACGAVSSIAPTATLIASLAVWMLITWFTKPEDMINEIIVTTRPFALVSRKFS